MKEAQAAQGTIFNIQHFSIQDGPGIRTTLFLKGCPLHCPWCSNPESILSTPQIRMTSEKCRGCGECLAACKTGAMRLINEKIVLDRTLCSDCMQCSQVCSSGGISIIGACISTDEAVRILMKDKTFYEHTKGGVTISGGEPLRQPEFLESLLKDLRSQGIHTALDTTGCAPREILRRILEHVDLLLYDIKHLDPKVHKRVLGVDNGLILSNLTNCTGHPDIWLRIPLIPGFNGDFAFTDAVVDLALNVGAKRCHFLPFHRWGEHKYPRLGLKKPSARHREWEPGELDQFKKRYMSLHNFVFFEKS